jgi:hypothetical protein
MSPESRRAVIAALSTDQHPARGVAARSATCERELEDGFDRFRACIDEKAQVRSPGASATRSSAS